VDIKYYTCDLRSYGTPLCHASNWYT